MKYKFFIKTYRFLGFEWQVSFDSLPTVNELLGKLAEYIGKDIKEHYGFRLKPTEMYWATEPDSLNTCMAINGESFDLTDDELFDYLEKNEASNSEEV